MKKTCVLPPHFNKRLISNLMASKPPDPTASTSFSLKSTRDFASRSGQVFEGLQNLEKKHETWISENETFKGFEDVKQASTDPLVQDSFKKPLPMPIALRHSSNRRRTQRKWKKYSLENIPLSTDANNAAIAFKFLDELRKRRESNSNAPESSDDGKVVFNKFHNKRFRRNTETNTFSSSNKESDADELNTNKLGSENSSMATIKLSHLEEESDG